jgi:Galactose oxidase, central domain
MRIAIVSRFLTIESTMIRFEAILVAIRFVNKRLPRHYSSAISFQGPHIRTCLVYDHSITPGSGSQWKFFESLPIGRAGAAMVYDPRRNALIFAGGAERPVAGSQFAVDYKNAWMYELDKPGWRPLPDIPYFANHMSFVTTKDSSGKDRHYFVGGQIGENETTGNVKANYEFDAINEQWLKRKDMPISRGHASSSTNAVPCGYIIAGGSTNEFGRTADVSHYDVASDSWTKIGDLPTPINTPVCAIDFKAGMYRCETGLCVS